MALDTQTDIGANKKNRIIINNMKKTILTLLLASYGILLFAQNNNDSNHIRPGNGIYLNLLGDASLISINYEKLFFVSSNFIVTGKSGLGYNEKFQICFGGPCWEPKRYVTVPHHITGNIGEGRNFLEFGLGGTIIGGNTSQHYLLYPIVGYRLVPLKANKLNFRIFGQIPFSGLETEDVIFVPIGGSLGLSF